MDRKNIFDLFDQDNDGKITEVEIVKTFRQLCLPITNEQAHMLVTEFDKNGDGELEFTEFLSMVKKYMKMEDYPVEGMFNYFDQDGDGFITVEEFVSSLKYLGISVTLEDAQHMMGEYLTPTTAGMDYSDFLFMMHQYF